MAETAQVSQGGLGERYRIEPGPKGAHEQLVRVITAHSSSVTKLLYA
jgi:hypothetical protein